MPYIKIVSEVKAKSLIPEKLKFQYRKAIALKKVSIFLSESFILKLVKIIFDFFKEYNFKKTFDELGKLNYKKMLDHEIGLFH